VRHNEEELNLELSKSLPWGHDLSKVSFWMVKKKNPGNLLDIMLDPHTKCFLLLQVTNVTCFCCSSVFRLSHYLLYLQAFIFKSKLPISDYINDMRSVIDQIPRLLAAMEYIAQEDKGSAGSFEMFSCFSIVRRIFHTGTMNPNSNRSKVVYPATFEHVWVSKKTEKSGTRHAGRIEIGYKIDRSLVKNSKTSDGSKLMNVNLVLGTLKGGYLLQTSSFAIPQYQKEQFWTKTVGLDFDWSLAEANGGETNDVILRVIHEFAHSIDLELVISLKHPD
jgi:hypothetical protein